MQISPDMIDCLRSSRRICALTGAGVSQESGLRTFRDAQTGLWSQYKPEDLATPEAFQRDPKLVWDWYAWRREALKGVRSNAGHFALARMAENLPGFVLVTQNVDGLHRLAGNQQIIELHGNIQRVRCIDGHGTFESWITGEDGIGRCPECGAFLRPDVVWFGEPLPRLEFENAISAARSCDVFLSIGTSGIVQPAASLPYAARNRGAKIIEINLEPTPLTNKADYFLQGRSGEILPALVEAVFGITGAAIEDPRR